MKRGAAAAVACLTVALSGAYAAPAIVKGKPRKPRNQAAATLGNALRASIPDAIRGAVKNVEAHESHEAKPHVLTQRASRSLRGGSERESNPWQPAKPLRIISNDLTPTAPMDRVMPGVEAQQGGLMPPGYWPRVVYYPSSQDIVNPFPESYHSPVPNPPENYMACHTSPEGWTDIKGMGCGYYASARWCTEDGKVGPQWKSEWGTFQKYARLKIAANQACCQCGGGARVKLIGYHPENKLDDRRLVAPEDRVPDPQARWFEKNNFQPVPPRPLRPIQAPEDYVPLPVESIAPADRLGPPGAGVRYARYFKEIHEEDHKETPRGFSVRYYKVPPNDDCKAIPSASSLTMGMDYGSHGNKASLLDANSSVEMDPVKFPKFWSPPELKTAHIRGERLQWPVGNTKKAPPLWYGKWSGTMMILESGIYTFNLDVGFNTVSWLKVDDKKILTDGQCKVSADEGTCKAKQCTWNKTGGSCTAVGDTHVASDTSETCQPGMYRASPILFSCQADGGETPVVLHPAAATELLTVPAGIKNFNIEIQSPVGGDLEVLDKQDNTYVVKFAGGVVNNQQRDSTYKGMGVSFSGASPAHEYVKLEGVTSSPLTVSVVSYSSEPVTARLIWSHRGHDPCPGPTKGCEPYDPGQGQESVDGWCKNLLQRYKSVELAWQAVLKAYPGGQVSWSQFDSVWSMAWGQETAEGEPGGARAWQIGFAVVDTSHDNYVQEEEYCQACSRVAAAPAPPPAPAAISTSQGNPGVYLDKCLCVKLMDKASWPTNAFDGTGFADSPLLDQLAGIKAIVKSENDKGVMVDAPDGKQEWFYPKGTYYCVQAGSSTDPTSAPTESVSSRGPAPSIANIVPSLSYGASAGGSQGAALVQEDLPEALIANKMYMAAGAHCVEAMVMVTPNGRSLHLEYSGKDTLDKLTVIPGQLVHCDPVIQACENPLRDSCMSYRPHCP